MTHTGIGRRIVGVTSGVAVAILVIILIEMLGHSYSPPPAGLNPMNADDARQIIESMPPMAMSFVLAAWFIGSLVGGWVAARIARWSIAPWLVAAFVMAGGIWSFVMIPHPLWMMAAGMALPLLAALWIARRMHSI